MTSPAPTPEPTLASARRLPWALAWMLAYLVALELVARLLWRPDIVAPELYSELDASFGYGFEFVRPPCEPLDDEQLICRPTQYRRIPEQRLARVKPPHTIRLFTLGGSHAAGRDAYTQRLAKQLERRCPSLRWEAVNFAVQGQGSRRALLAAEQALAYEPDLLIVDFGGSNEYEDERDWDYHEQLHAGIWTLLFDSHAIVLGRKLLSKSFPIVEPPALDTAANERAASREQDNLERWRAGLLANYGALLELAAEHDVDVVLVGRASLRRHAPGSRELGDHRVFEQLAGDDPLVLDTHARFQALPPGRRAGLFRKDENHYSAAGHARIAEDLAELLLTEYPGAAPCAQPGD